MAPFAFSQVSSADFIEMGRHLGQLQRELHGVRNREEERDRRTELSLEAIEALIGAREEDSDRRFQEQAQENADRISKVRFRWSSPVQTARHSATYVIPLDGGANMRIYKFEPLHLSRLFRKTDLLPATRGALKGWNNLVFRVLIGMRTNVPARVSHCLNRSIPVRKLKCASICPEM